MNVSKSVKANRLAAGRQGDMSKCQHDSHSCSSCPHSVLGPSVCGSGDVLINLRPALRVADYGTHRNCCGSQRWSAAGGAPCVLINGRRPHRSGDRTEHCGGMGQLAGGSPNVLIGNWCTGAGEQATTAAQETTIAVSFLGLPMNGARIRVHFDDGFSAAYSLSEGEVSISHPNRTILYVEVLPKT